MRAPVIDPVIDKGPDTSNPLALIGASVLSAVGGYLASLLTRHKHDTDDDEAGCATKAELRVLRSDLGGDISYVREQVDAMQGTLSRIIRSGGHGEHSGRGD